MAYEPDGSIIVDTELDTQGFKAGSKEIKAAVIALINEIRHFGEDISKIFDNSSKGAAESSRQTEAYETTISNLRLEIQNLKSEIEELKSEIQATGNTKIEPDIDVKKVKSKASGLKESLSSFSNSDDVESDLNKLKAEIDALRNRKIVCKFDYNSLMSAQVELERLQEKFDELYSKLEFAKKNPQKAQALGMDTEQMYQDAARFHKTVEEKRAEYEKLLSIEEQYRKNDSAQWSSKDQSVLETKANKYNELVSVYNRLIEKENELEAKETELSKTFSESQEQINNSVYSSNKYMDALSDSLQDSGRKGIFFSSVSMSLRKNLSILGSLSGSVAKKAGHVSLEFAKWGGKKVLNGIKSLVKNIRKGSSSLNIFKKSSGNAEGSISRLSKKITGLGSMLKRMVLRKVLQGVIQGVKDGINNLAQYSDEVNGNLSTLKSGLTQLKNSLATAFAPILTVITPILAKLISYLSAAITKVGQFFAALTGKNKFTKAVAVQEDYAASLDKTAKSSTKAAKAAQKYGDALDIDEVHDIQSIDSSVDSGSGTSVNDMFTEVEVESKISEFVNKLKKALKKGDLSSIGEDFAVSMNKNISRIKGSISKFKKITVRYAKAIATFLNGFTENFDWKNAGSTIADGLNLIAETVESFVTNIHWSSYATALTDSIKGFLEGINWNSIQNSAKTVGKGFATFLNGVFNDKKMWDDIGTSLGNSVNTVLSLVLSFVSTFDLSSAGSAFATSINSIFNTIKWEDVSETILKGLGGILDFLISSVATMDWRQVGDTIGQLLVDLITPDEDGKTLVDKVFELLSKLLIGALDLLIGFVESFDNTDLTNAFEDLFTKIFTEIEWKTIILKVLQLIGSTVKKLIKEAFGLKDKDMFSGLLDSAQAMLEYCIESINIKSKSKDKGKEIAENVEAGFEEGSDTEKYKKVSEKAANTVISTFKKILGIASPSKVLKSIGDYTLQGFINGISGNSNKLRTSLDSVASIIKNKFSSGNLKSWTWGKDICINLSNGIRSGINLVGNAVTKVANKIKALIGFSEPDEGPLSNFHTYMPDMLKLMADGIDKNKGIALDAVSSLASDVSKKIQDGDYTFSAVGFENEVDTSLTDFSDTIIDSFADMLDRLQAIADNVTFTVPQVVTGIVPYGPSSGGFPKGDKQDFIDELHEMIKDLLLSIRPHDNGDPDKNIILYATLNVDGKELGTVVAKPAFEEDIRAGRVRVVDTKVGG